LRRWFSGPIQNSSQSIRLPSGVVSADPSFVGLGIPSDPGRMFSGDRGGGPGSDDEYCGATASLG
jgi:hypothetical protein